MYSLPVLGEEIELYYLVLTATHQSEWSGSPGTCGLTQRTDLSDSVIEEGPIARVVLNWGWSVYFEFI